MINQRTEMLKEGAETENYRTEMQADGVKMPVDGAEMVPPPDGASIATQLP